MAVVLAVTKSKGMKVTGAVDSYLVGEDIRKVHEIRPGILCLEATGYLSDIFYDELPLKSSRNTFALLTILNEVDMNMYATGKFTIAMVDEPSSNGSATVSKVRVSCTSDCMINACIVTFADYMSSFISV
ncbi:hypothetical protein Tco_0879887 [Tanacetum coccineum]